MFSRCRVLPSVVMMLVGLALTRPVTAAQVVANWLSPVSGNWNTAAAWSTDPLVPNNDATNTFLVNINAIGAGYTVTFNSGPVIVDALNLNAPVATFEHQINSLQAGTVIVSAGTYNLSAATLISNTLSISSVFNFNGGTLSGGTATIAPSGVMTVGTITTRTLSQAINNTGTINFLANSSLTLSNGTINNTGVINFAPMNLGVFNVGVGSNNGFTNSGTLNITGAGTTNFGNISYVNSGTMNVGANSYLNFNVGTFTHNAGTRFNGGGTLLLNGGTLLFDGASTLSTNHVVFNGSTIGGAGAMSLESTFDWNGGSFAGTGTTTIAPNTTMNIGTFSFRTLARQLDNNGTINFLPNASLTLSNGTINNQGVMNFGANTIAIINAGAGSNNGLINSGTWNIFGTGTSSLGTLNYVNSGTISISGASVLSYNFGTFTHNAGTRFTGAGTLLIGGATMLFNGASTISTGRTVLNVGAINGAGPLALDSTFDWNGGSLNVSGGVTLSPAATLNIGTFSIRTLTGPLVNNGVINMVSNTSLTLSNGTVTNLGVINIGSNTVGAFVTGAGSNNGLINSGTINIAGAGTTSIGVVNYNNTGTISVGGSSVLAYQFGTFTHNAGTRITGPGTLLLNGGTMIFDGASTISTAKTVFQLGTMMGSGSVTLDSNFDWSGGTISGSGTTTILPTATMNIGTFSGRTLARTLINNGTVNFLPNGSLTILNGTLNNQGVMNFNQPALNYFTAGAGTFASVLNSGTWNVAGSGTASFGNLNYQNSGTIDVSGSTTLSYSFGTYTHNAGTRFTGPGTILLNGGTMIFAGASTISTSRFVMNSGVLSGAGSVLFNSSLDWNNGTMVGTGTTAIASSGTLNLGTLGSRTLTRTLVNNGRTNFIGTASLILSNGKFVNGATGILPLTGQPNFVTGAGTSQLQNDGAIYVPGGTITISVPFVNNGSINIGTPAPGSLPFTTTQLMVNNPLQLVGTTLSGGTWRVSDGAELLLPGPVQTNNSTVILAGVSASFPAISGLLTNNGTFQLSGGKTFTTSESLTNNGVLLIDAGSGLTVSGAMLGTGNVQLNGALAATGNASFGNLDGSASLTVQTEQNVMANRVRLPQVTINTNGILSLTGSGGSEGVSVINKLTLSGSFASPTAILNTQRNDVILTLGPTASGTPDDIRQLIRAGYNNTTWTGQGIRSSTAITDGKAIGYATASSTFPALPGTWKGQPIDSSSLILAYTFAGDSNLDGKVNTIDFNALAGAFGQSGKSWVDGDYDYEASVNSVDFNMLVANYGKVQPMSAPLGAAPSGSTNLGTTVPEPATGAVALVAMFALVPRKRGNRRTM